MKKIEFADNWRELFSRSGLDKFSSFFEETTWKILTRNEKRDVAAFSIETEEEVKHFFVKRFFSPLFKDRMFALINCGRIVSQAECECNNANTLLEKGIETYRPVCWGKETFCGIEKRSFYYREDQGLLPYRSCGRELAKYA